MKWKKLLIIYPIRVPREESSAEKKMEAIMAEISPNFVKDKLIDSRNSKQIQIKKKKSNPTHITIQQLKTKYKQKS